MTDADDEASLEAERCATKFEKLLEQLDRRAKDKKLPENAPGRGVDGHS